MSSNNFVLNSTTNFYPTTPTDISGCVCYMPLNISGTYTYSSDNLHSGLLVGDSYFDGGRLGSGVHFPGSQTNASYIRINDGGLSTSGGFTYSAWIRPSGTKELFNMFMGRFLPYFAVLNKGNLGLSYNVSGVGQRSLTGSTILQDGIWYHAVGRHVVDEALEIYLNGKSDGKFTTNVGKGIDTNTPQYLGKYSTATTQYFFGGDVDEVSIFNRGLNKTEIEQLYNLGYSKFTDLNSNENEFTLNSTQQNTELTNSQNNFNLNNQQEFIKMLPSDISGCAYYWDFNEGTGSIVYDKINNTPGGFYTDNVRANANWVGGREGSGFYLNNFPAGGEKNTWLTSPAPYSPNECTLSFWCKNPGPGSPNNYIMRGNANNRTYVTCNSAGSLSFYKGNPGVIWSATPYAVSSGCWNHIAFQWMPSGTTINGSYFGKVFINAREVGSRFFTDATSGTYVYFGASAADREWGSGYIDDFAIYNRALTNVEIEQIYNMGKIKPIILQGGTT